MSVLISGIYLVHFKYSAQSEGFSSYTLLLPWEREHFFCTLDGIMAIDSA